jgi:hypothetical protein
MRCDVAARLDEAAVLVDGGHGRRTAPVYTVAYKRVAVPSVVLQTKVTPSASRTEKSKPIHQIGSKKGLW